MDTAKALGTIVVACVLIGYTGLLISDHSARNAVYLRIYDSCISMADDKGQAINTFADCAHIAHMLVNEEI